MTINRHPDQPPLFAVGGSMQPEAKPEEPSPRADLGYKQPKTYAEALRLVGINPPRDTGVKQRELLSDKTSPEDPDLEKLLRDKIGFFFSDGIFKGATCLCAYDTLTDNEDTGNILCTIKIKNKNDQAEVELAKSTIIKFLIDQHWQHQNIKAA